LRKTADAGIVFETHVLEIELLFKKGELTEAFNYISDRIDEAKSGESVGMYPLSSFVLRLPQNLVSVL